MKTTFKLMVGALLLLAACKSKKTEIQEFIPGIYVNEAENEYGIDHDTLIIEPADGNHYLVTRKTGYRAIRDGKLLPKHHKIKELDAVWDSGNKEMDETTDGLIFRFDPDKRQLLIHRIIYTKLK